MTEQFDVFLCHNSQDKPQVREIAIKLQQNGLKPWLDEWELPPGHSWQELLEEEIESIKSAAVFVGGSGLGPWQEREMRAFLSEFVNRRCPVIPVLLENAPNKPNLPIFLKAMTWVNFQQTDSKPMERLIWGITGKKPTKIFTTQTSIIVEPPKPEKLQNFTEDLGNGVKLEMIAIPAGEFWMGTDEDEIERLCKEYNWDGFRREKARHQVRLKEFHIGKYPITQAQYEAIMGNNPSKFKGQNNPVEGVSWYDAQEFCQKLSAKTEKKYYKLPSEAQWEYACRAGSKTRYCFGDDVSQLSEYAWYRNNSNDQTHPVGQKKANKWGLYDMHGNVWEYCEDDWHGNYKNAPDNGTSWIDKSSEYFVQRGGSWYNFLYKCRSAYRNDYIMQDSRFNFGFRVVCELGRTL